MVEKWQILPSPNKDRTVNTATCPPRIDLKDAETACRKEPDGTTWTRQNLFGIQIDAIGMQGAVARIHRWLEDGSDSCHMVVTPNVDHIVQLQENAELRQAYQQASLVLADGWPVVTASRWLGKALPERVAGSDLVPAIFQAAQDRWAGCSQDVARRPQLRVFLLGAAPGVADRAAARIQAQWPAVQVVGTYSPPMGFEKRADENQLILAKVAAARPQVLVVGLGAPKQELWVARHQAEIDASVALCVGATIDFLAGEKRRAPAWMQRLRLEWLHRMLSEPRRLVKRYWHDARVFPSLVWREYRQSRANRSTRRPGAGS